MMPLFEICGFLGMMFAMAGIAFLATNPIYAIGFSILVIVSAFVVKKWIENSKWTVTWSNKFWHGLPMLLGALMLLLADNVSLGGIIGSLDVIKIIIFIWIHIVALGLVITFYFSRTKSK
jgi:hypothetical protein